MRFSTIIVAATAFVACTQAVVVDRQISVPFSVTCIIDDDLVDVLKRWGEPTATITSSVSAIPIGTTSYSTATAMSTTNPFYGFYPCYSTTSNKRFVEEHQISVPVEVICTLDNDIVTVGTTPVGLLGEIL